MFGLSLKEMDVEFIGQLVNSMEEAVIDLERAVKKKKTDDAVKLKGLILDLHRKLGDLVKENV